MPLVSYKPFLGSFFIFHISAGISRQSPLEVSPRRLYFDTDSLSGGSISEQIRPPRKLYSKTKSPGKRERFIPRRNKLSPAGVFTSTRVRLYSHHIYS